MPRDTARGAPPSGAGAAQESAWLLSHASPARERRRVHAGIAQLEPEGRALVVLRDIEGLSYEEIVDVLELPLGTVKSRLHRARERLAELLGEGEP